MSRSENNAQRHSVSASRSEQGSEPLTFRVAVLSPTSVALTWTKAPAKQANAVELFYKGMWHQCGGTQKPQTTSTAINGLTPGTYDLDVVYLVGRRSAWESPKRVTMPKPPPLPIAPPVMHPQGLGSYQEINGVLFGLGGPDILNVTGRPPMWGTAGSSPRSPKPRQKTLGRSGACSPIWVGTTKKALRRNCTTCDSGVPGTTV